MEHEPTYPEHVSTRYGPWAQINQADPAAVTLPNPPHSHEQSLGQPQPSLASQPFTFIDMPSIGTLGGRVAVAPES